MHGSRLSTILERIDTGVEAITFECENILCTARPHLNWTWYEMKADHSLRQYLFAPNCGDMNGEWHLNKQTHTQLMWAALPWNSEHKIHHFRWIQCLAKKRKFLCINQPDVIKLPKRQIIIELGAHARPPYENGNQIVSHGPCECERSRCLPPKILYIPWKWLEYLGLGVVELVQCEFIKTSRSLFSYYVRN